MTFPKTVLLLAHMILEPGRFLHMRAGLSKNGGWQWLYTLPLSILLLYILNIWRWKTVEQVSLWTTIQGGWKQGDPQMSGLHFYGYLQEMVARLTL